MASEKIKRLEEIIPFSPIREELQSATGRLFEGALREYLREFSIGSGDQARIFQLAVTPLEMNERVNGLVFTYTDITDSKRTEAEIKHRNEELVALIDQQVPESGRSPRRCGRTGRLACPG